MVLERYRSKEDFAEVHLKSETFGNFFKLVQSIEAVETSLKEFSSEEMVPQLKAFSPGPNAAVEAPQKLVAKGALILAGSRTGARPAYVKEAEALGELVVKTLQRPFLYGGGTIGLMGAAANAAKRVPGSHVVAVIPEALKPREVSGDMICDKLYVSEDMSERKSIMLRHADMIIALPGGFGTFDELFEYLTLFQLNAARQKIGLLNVEGFFNTFIAHVEFLIAEGFLNKEAMGYFVIEPTAAELVEALQRFTPPPASLPLQW